jgi:phosphatidylglycerol:prolipoprotein diacylglycerol transferase
VHEIAFRLGNLEIHWYGILVAAGFLAGIWTASRRARLTGVPSDFIQDIGFWLLVGGMLGARVLYILTYWRPEKGWGELQGMIFSRTGFVFYGGLMGATVAGVLFARARKQSVWKVADVLAPSIALGHFFGRLGCLMTGCCFGRVCSLPWAIQFPNQSAAWFAQHDLGLVGDRDPSLPVHPTQLYESLLNLVLYAVLAWLYRRKKFDGQVFATYLCAYAVLRSTVEMFRGDYETHYLFGWVTPAHLVSVVILAFGLFLFWRLPRRLILAPAIQA